VRGASRLRLYGESAEYRSRIAFLAVPYGAESSDALVDVEDSDELRLRMLFIRMIMKACNMPMGFLGGLPGPVVW